METKKGASPKTKKPKGPNRCQVQSNRALKECRQKLQRVLADISDVHFIADENTVITELSPSFETIFSIRRKQMIGKPIDTLIAKKEEREKFSALLQRKKKITDFEFAVDSNKGRTRLCVLDAARHPGSGDTQPIITGTVRDVTGHRLAERELQTSRQQLQQSQKMEALGTLVAGVAHEINNPINLIMYNTPLLKKIWSDFMPVLQQHAQTDPQRKYGGLQVTFLEENLAQLLADVDMAANRIAKIVTDLKNFVQQSTETEKKPIDLNEAVQNALRLVQTTLRKSGVKHRLKLQSNLPQMTGNLQNIEQVILNLIINAVQSIHHNKGRIQIETGQRKSDGWIFVSVGDNGRGVDPKIADRLFDPFVTDKQAHGGTGLGLSVSYNLVKAHKGNIDFETETGRGTTFTVTFPTAEKREKAKILIVDDDPDVRRLLATAFTTRRPYAIDEAANGIEACIKLGSYHPAVLILDVFMPDMDGVEVCRAIANDPKLKDVRVIVTTGFPQHPKIAEVTRLGFQDIFAKPFNLPEFIEFVDHLLTK